MFDARRPVGRLFCLLMSVTAMLAVSQAQGPATTTINDVVYRADGTPAGGVLLISWPAFTTAAGQAVAAGKNSVTLGTGGALTVSLVPNAGATPAGTVYTVVYQLNDGTEKTEYWTVPTTSPTTLAAVRTILGTTSSATQIASQQYVNTAVAAKANDAAVVHLAGSETVTGVKAFTAAPSVPTPVQSTDAANKAYVDGAVTAGGSGSFVSKAGDTMTGPLTLPADPVASLQASTKHYVDVGLASKSDLIGGLVPATELGAGTASSSTCLQGNQTWGPCGTSSNAVEIQSIPVDTTAPADNQVITYVASAGKYEPRAGGGVSGGMQSVKYSSDFNWSQTPAADLTAAGAKTVNLTACPLGVTGTESQYYVYIAGTGTAEAVLVTGGTCAGNGQPGSLQFTTVNAHAAGYTLGSASSGLQEALIGARFSPDAIGMQSGRVVVTPGSELYLYARVSIRSGNMTVDFSGSLVRCLMNDTCIYVGDPTQINEFSNITLVAPHGRPGVANGQHPFIEVNAQKTRIYNVVTQYPYQQTNATFSSYVQVDSDEAFLLDGLDVAWGSNSGNSSVLCNATTCNPIVYAPGPSGTNSAVGWLKHMNLTLNCAANGVDWESGNSVHISDSVIQGFAQYGVRGGTARGGFVGMKVDNVYEETGLCSNPQANIGSAGIIAQGGSVEITGPAGVGVLGSAGGPQGVIPLFANTGTTTYRYYVVAHNASFGASNPLYAGYALTNGTGSITVTTPDIGGAATFDLLRITLPANSQNQFEAPYGTGSYAVASGVTRGSACANGVCTFTDTQAALSSYTVAAPSYFPLLNFWPGNLILGANQDTNGVLAGAVAFMPSMPQDVVDVQGMLMSAVVAQYCAASGDWTPMLASCYANYPPSGVFAVPALVLATKPAADAGQATNLKGRLNFATLGSGPGHIITLSDSNFQKTVATSNNRPGNDASDAYIGYDRGGGPTTYGISFGAPVSLSNYIGNVGDGTNWLERLTSSLKEFKTNVQMDSGLTVAGQVQASSFLWTGNGPWSVQAGFGTLSAAPAGESAIGFGTSGKLQVSENGGAVVEVAKLDSNGNVSENADTATALAVTPAQCSGSFATGIQANGNANCGTADVVQLAETTPPTGIANFGLFWFDSTCHCPKVIDNNGQVVQLGLTNAFNSDALGTNVANVIEERNGANPQALRVFNNYTNSSTWDFFGMDYDSVNSRYRIWSNDAGTSAPGIEFQIQGTVPWYISSNLNLLTGTDNVRDVGADTLGIRNLFFGSFLDGETGGALVTEMANAGTTGTTLNALAKLTGAPSTAVMAATSDTGGVLGVVNANAGTTCAAGTSGKACIVTKGPGTCNFDGAVTAGDYVQISATTAGDCHDAGATYPTSGQVLGRVLVSNGSAGTYSAYFFGAESQGALSGATAAATYAPLASAALTGTPTAPTPSAGDDSTKIATTAFVTSTCLWTTFPTTSGTGNTLSATANKATLWKVWLPAPCSTSAVTYDIGTADNTTNTYDLGLYSASGALMVHTGSTAGTTFASATGVKDANWTASTVLAAGIYYIGLTSSCTASCATLAGASSNAIARETNTTVSVSSGGTLSATVTAPVDASSGGAQIPALIVR